MLQETGIGKTLIHYNLLEVGFEPTQVIGIIPEPSLQVDQTSRNLSEFFSTVLLSVQICHG